MLRAALLDGDGVLVDSERYFHLDVSETLKLYDITIDTDEYIQRWMITDSGMRGLVGDYRLEERGIRAGELIRKRDAILYGYIKQGLILQCPM